MDKQEVIYYARASFMLNNPQSPISMMLGWGMDPKRVHVRGVPALIFALRQGLPHEAIEDLVDMGCEVDVCYQEASSGRKVTPLTEAISNSACLKTVRMLADLSNSVKLGWAATVARETPGVPEDVRVYMDSLERYGYAYNENAREPPRKGRRLFADKDVHFHSTPVFGL